MTETQRIEALERQVAELRDRLDDATSILTGKIVRLEQGLAQGIRTRRVVIVNADDEPVILLESGEQEGRQAIGIRSSTGVLACNLGVDDEGGLLSLNDIAGRSLVSLQCLDECGVVAARRGDGAVGQDEVLTPPDAD